MNNLERFKKVMAFEKVDHPPLLIDEPWGDTWARWYQEGYHEGVSLEEYFEITPTIDFENAGLNTGLYPGFPEKVISENENEIVKIDYYGRTVRDFKNNTTIPEWLEFPVKSPGDLERIIKEHFDPGLLHGRWPKDWEIKKKQCLKRLDLN